MTFDDAVERALESVADGRPVDWPLLERLADLPDRVDLVAQLRVLAGVGATHGASESATPLASAPEDTMASPADHGPTPLTWGRFELVRPLGQGSYGVVYLGHDGVLHRDVAIKLFQGTIADAVKREGRLLAKLKHDNVVKIYDVAEHDGRFGLCMEYIEGRTFADIVRVDGPLSGHQAALEGQAICRALTAVHASNVLHRDVTHRNVMRERGGRVVLMDLGAGVATDPGRGTPQKNVGTPLFMAPELLDESSSATPRTDVYSLGVLLYYLVTGRFPVEGVSIDEIRTNHAKGHRVPLDERRPDLPPGYVDVVERATAPVAADRYESAVSLLRDLNRLVAPPPDRWRWVKAAAVIALSAVVLAALSGLVASFAFNNVIDRPAVFDTDGPIDKFILGARALVQPLIIGGGWLGLGAVATLVFRVLGWRRLWPRLRAALVPRDLKEDEYAAALAQAAVLMAFVALAFVAFVFDDVLVSFIRSVSTYALDEFAVFRPGPEAAARRVAYRNTLVVSILLVGVIWKGANAARLKYGGTIPGWIRGAVFALLGVLFVCCQAPYKLMRHNDLDVVLVDGQRCALVGERATEARVFCAGFDVPRVRTIPLPHPTFTRCGFEESVFTGSTAGRCARGDQSPQ